MWRFRPPCASFRLHSFLPSSSPLILLFFILRHPSYSFLEWRGRRTTGRLGRRFGCGGAATTPGPRWVPEAATPEAGPGSPAPRPAHLNTLTRRPLDPRMPGYPEYLRGPWGASEGRGKFDGQELLPCYRGERPG